MLRLLTINRQGKVFTLRCCCTCLFLCTFVRRYTQLNDHTFKKYLRIPGLSSTVQVKNDCIIFISFDSNAKQDVQTKYNVTETIYCI